MILGWLIVVQFFATLALMASYAGQCILVALLLRWPLDIILRFEVWFCGTALVLNACTGTRENNFLFCMGYWKIIHAN